jgi:pilus assembly protein CpaB
VAAQKGSAFMGIAVLLGAAAAVAAYFSITALSSQAAMQNSRDFRPVVIAAGEMTYGQKLEASMLRVVKLPKDAVPAGAYSTVDSVVGQTTKVFMAAREPVTEMKLSTRGGGLSMLVRPTMRAASIEVNQVSGVSGFVLPGDRVDVLVTIRDREDNKDPVTQTILQNVEVLAAGQKTQQQDNKPITVQAVTLLVGPDGAEKLAHAQQEGEITLTLRNPEDLEEVTVASTSTRLLVGERAAVASAAPRRVKAKPAAAKATAAATAAATPARRTEPVKVRVIRGSDVKEQNAPKDVVNPDGSQQ